MMRPITKYTKQVVSGNNIPSIVREAFRISQQERPGAVHIELPEDVAAEDTNEQLFDVAVVRRPAPDHKAIYAAIEISQL